ncbi:prolactin-releasing peptide receptor-like [Acropora millepora]|uniref:prolactin-releasing peptide receptor-like n=1 Tax=Acropora millepora TaxID=45264 RepID=UPI001CF538A8|nr:prolactin-releasing peptide receptor-like [Acropora millepora]XP_044177473.1 prolactin-releasing peptide receptor-like [Acropora millepora]XP_044177474.1 prolactin-releasing peptide receptor-like [Acropora millepora]XP_044177475.1 prolactin-releasing peptide receptor-like [Acropora millepora]XP_044177476.1 prolactin-releasing peptide receptor-like [Acropora millepora]XP_044177478.1 prolactin-releasing peptide receptor-like [Acropora millepora]XP_044177479.1 prolactin-releasing peptide rece
MSGNSTATSFTSNSSNEPSAGCATVTAMSKEEKAILMPFYCISLLVALIGNVLIIVVFYKYKPIRKSINYFVLNMAISDLFTPLTIMPYIIAKTLSNGPGFLSQLPSSLAKVICKLCFFLADTSTVVSIVSLLMISLDRFIAVVFPLQIKLISMKVRFICILMSWVVAFSVRGLYLRRMDNFQGECCLDLDEESYNDYSLAIFISLFFIPVCLLTITYGAIAVTLKRGRRKRKNMSKSKKSHDQSSNRKIIGLSVAILAGFIISIGPFVVYSLILIILKGKDPPGFGYPSLIFIITKLLLHSWGTFNPCMCFAFSENYRTGLKHVFFGGCRAGSLSPSGNTKLTSSRKRTRSSSSHHFNIKAVKGNGNKWFKLAGEEKYHSQEQEKGDGKQELKL